MGVVYRGTASLLPAPATRFLSGIFPPTTYSPGHRLQMMAARLGWLWIMAELILKGRNWDGSACPLRTIVPTQRGPHLGSDQPGMRSGESEANTGDALDPKEEQPS